MDSFKVYIVVRHALYLKDILELLKEKRKTHEVEFYYFNGWNREDLEDEGFIWNESIYNNEILDALITCYPDAVYSEKCREANIKIRILR